MNTRDYHRLYDRWLDIWNGNTGLIDEIVDENCIIHQTGTDMSMAFTGSEGIKQMVSMGRMPFYPITFACEVEPIVEGNRLAARWICEGSYRGGIPGATAPAGTTITFGGIDILYIKSGKIKEYWVSSDGLHLMHQLGVIKK